MGSGEMAAREAGWSEQEKQNVEVVRGFVTSMGKLPAEERYRRHFAPDALARWESKPHNEVQWGRTQFIEGVEALVAGSKRYEDAKVNYVTELHDLYAAGSLVVAKRTDIRLMDDGSRRPVPAVGVFIVRNGKIAEWQDYFAEG